MTHTRRDFLRRCGSGALIAAATVPRPAASGRLVAEAVDHVDVWRETGRYGGWPANHGMWAWGDELLVGFTAGVLRTGDPMRHPIDRSAGEQQALARSRDGGRTWTLEAPATLQTRAWR
ncbi:MAG: twin-arginine translocation signal domain-containing protein [Acidobacteria bacterium]|nr:twin-arginine translocation signal domain-containing protein [Acidobacteriota bacterium]